MYNNKTPIWDVFSLFCSIIYWIKYKEVEVKKKNMAKEKCPLYYNFAGSNACLATNRHCDHTDYDNDVCLSYVRAYNAGKDDEKLRWVKNTGHNPDDNNMSEWIKHSDNNTSSFYSFYRYTCKVCQDDAPVRPTAFCPNCGRFMKNWEKFK